MKRASLKGIIFPLLLVVVGASIAVGAYVTTTGGSLFELRKKAAPVSPNSRLYFKGPTQVKIGEQFTVNLYLDTTNDPQYTISGVDARISIAGDASASEPSGKPRDGLEVARWFPPQVLSLTKVTPGKIFDSYPNLGNTSGGDVWGREGVSQQGSSGQSSVAVTSILTTPFASPPADVCPPFPGCDVINNPQIRMPWELCWEPQMRKCPVPSSKPKPTSDALTISGVKNYAVDEKGRFKGFTGTGVVATLTFTAERPGKATLQFAYISPTATDDTNITGFLADQPASLQKPQERLTMAPDAFTIEVVSATPTASVTPPSCIPLPDCVDGVEDTTGRKIGICQLTPPPPGQTYCPRPTVTAKPTVGPPTTVTPLPPTPTPTPTPEPRVIINFRLQLEGRKNHATVVDIYGISTIYAQPSKEVLQLLGSGGSTSVVGGTPLPSGRIDKLGTTITDTSGLGTLSLDRTYVESEYYLLAQTPSHLRKVSQNYQSIRLGVGQNPVCRAEVCTQELKYVNFGTLTAGDVYADANENKDNLINTFDVGVLFANWSGADIVGRQEQSQETFLPKQPALADLNGDGVVNNRDLAMLLTNFNKRGQ